MTSQEWTEADFDTLSWHDNHIHAFRFVEGSEGSGDLVFDIDYIVEWLQNEGRFQFRIIPATLTFHEVTFPRMAIDFGAVSAAFGPLMIAGIERRSEQRAHYVAQMWKIPITFPKGEIEFEARGFTQCARGPAILSDGQSLSPEARARAS